jgi:hypothetical protein
LIADLPDEVATTVVRVAAEKRRPRMTPEELVGVLAKAGVPAFAERVRSRIVEAGIGEPDVM